MPVLSYQEIEKMEKRYRAQFVNSLSGFKSANLIGTRSKNGQTNLSIVSSVFHLGSDPALLGMIIRPHTVPRHSFEYILETKYWTVNHVSSDFYKKAHQTSARYDKEVSEFEAVGLSEQYFDDFIPPAVAEAKISIVCELAEVKHLEINGCELVIGQIRLVSFPENCLAKDGHLSLEKADTIAIEGLDSYHRTSRISRLSYAKTDQSITEISVDSGK